VNFSPVVFETKYSARTRRIPSRCRGVKRWIHSTVSRRIKSRPRILLDERCREFSLAWRIQTLRCEKRIRHFAADAPVAHSAPPRTSDSGSE